MTEIMIADAFATMMVTTHSESARAMYMAMIRSMYRRRKSYAFEYFYRPL